LAIDTSRRGFFGVLTAIMAAPKALLASTNGSDKEIIYEAPVIQTQPGSKGLIQYAATIEDEPLKIAFAHGPFRAIRKKSAQVGRYYIDFDPPPAHAGQVPNVILQIHAKEGGPNRLGVVQDLSDRSFSVGLFDVASLMSAPGDFSLLVFWAPMTWTSARSVWLRG
jgi:hypothetical protein